MRNFIYILFLLAVLGCNKDDDTTLTTSEISGEWSLIHVRGGLRGIDESFEKGMILWTFNEEAKTINVINKNFKEVYDVLPTGTYTYSIKVTKDSKELLVDSNNVGNFELTTDQFTIDKQFKDGFLVTFKR